MTEQVQLVITGRDDLPEKALQTYTECVSFMAKWCYMHQRGEKILMAEDIMEEFKQNVGKQLIGTPRGTA